MPVVPNNISRYLFEGRVIAAYEEKRTVDVMWLSADTKKYDIPVVMNPGNYAFPNIGDVGLVIGDDTGYYFLGRIDFGYNSLVNDGIKDQRTNATIHPYRLIPTGAVYISNILKSIGLHLSNSGGFSLMNSALDGLKYLKNKSGIPIRWLQLAGRTVSMAASGSMFRFGTVVRSVPVQGDYPINDETGSQAAQELLAVIRRVVALAPVNLVRFHLGNILQEPVTNATVGIPEMSTNTGTPLRAVLEVNSDAGTPTLAALKFDQLGNVELTGTPAMILEAIQIFIGAGYLNVAEPAVLGASLIQWLNTHTHSSSVGPTGVPVTPAVPTDFLSTKVYLG